jgi:succinoglycan biosynthesis protein ExoM
VTSPASPERPVRVTVAIPTYRRPAELFRLIPLVVEQIDGLPAAGLTGYTAEVLVVDNDAQRTGEPVVRALDRPGLRYAVEPEPGISAVRNRILDESAGSAAVVMIDDDESPRPGWLAALLRTWRDEDAALVAGRVVAEFDGELPPWVAAGGFFDRRNHPTGHVVAAAAAGNLLLDVAKVRDAGVRFESTFGLSGGEDSLFSRRLHRHGARLVWCAESVAVDHVPAARMTPRYVLARARNHGNIHARIEVELSDGPSGRLRARLRRAVLGLGLVAAGAGRWTAGLLLRSLRHRARGLRMLVRGVGMVAAVVGVAHQEYARS